jgi:hypothetical protein
MRRRGAMPSASHHGVKGQSRHEADQRRPQAEGRHQENIPRPLRLIEKRMPDILDGLSGHCFPRFLFEGDSISRKF